tara:strand:+ start:3111 stop:3452 length:342 start_codon:yes stop_codon:yes gene_type:complete
MAGSRKGLHSYSVQEAQNAGLGQAGSVYLDTNATAFTPTNGVVVAITMLTDCKFDTLTAEGGTGNFLCIGKGHEDGGDTFSSSDVIPEGVTIYGRWTSVSVSADDEKCICYIG